MEKDYEKQSIETKHFNTPHEKNEFADQHDESLPEALIRVRLDQARLELEKDESERILGVKVYDNSNKLIFYSRAKEDIESFLKLETSKSK